ncbi:tyrosine-type recombinase/integrase [Alteribacter populi]|uniref:tyrosine-type recombinase/integrase n=1 Tax=Alteribacter populi TaxID=2011011 RepID=UPI000BBA769C|nr:tyrosine-type recombinase/integrase [Alteribacter populi]
MKYVEPIKDVKKIQEVKEILKAKSTRDYALFVLGINTGLRITELLETKVFEVMDSSGEIGDFLYPHSRTNCAYSQFYLNEQVKEALSLYLSEYSFSEDDFLFKSIRGTVPITRQQAYRVIHTATREAGIDHKVGTHTLRKTFGYHAYRKGVAISLLQKILKHTTKNETYDYLGINPNDVSSIRIDVNL